MGPATVQAMSHSLRYYIDQAAPGGQQITQLIFDHKAIGIFGVIAMEEVGIPIPLPGDVFIAYAGHLIARGAIDPLSAFLSVVVGSVVGSSVLYWLGRRFGQPFVKRYGPFMHAKPGRVQKLEGWFKRWGPLVVIFGRTSRVCGS
jgi:membrane protein DedA with SNARE-associated domain